MNARGQLTPDSSSIQHTAYSTRCNIPRISSIPQQHAHSCSTHRIAAAYNTSSRHEMLSRAYTLCSIYTTHYRTLLPHSKSSLARASWRPSAHPSISTLSSSLAEGLELESSQRLLARLLEHEPVQHNLRYVVHANACSTLFFCFL